MTLLLRSRRAFPSCDKCIKRRLSQPIITTSTRSFSVHRDAQEERGENAGAGGGSDKSAFTVLVLSNGHGEDTIAASVVTALLDELRSQEKRVGLGDIDSGGRVLLREVQALPIVGEGSPLRRLGLPAVCPTRVMPSGGFIYGRPASALGDIRHGLVGLTLGQIRSLWQWVEGAYDAGATPCLLAVGDVVPLAFAALACRFYRRKRKKEEKKMEQQQQRGLRGGGSEEKGERRKGKDPVVVFVGCAKSQHYLDQMQVDMHVNVNVEKKELERKRREKCVYYPWERWLLSHECCRLVAPRDELTAQVLTKHLRENHRGKVSYLGNPMMDNVAEQRTGLLLEKNDSPSASLISSCDKWVTLLPGTRKGEVLRNLQLILSVCATLVSDRAKKKEKPPAAAGETDNNNNKCRPSSLGFLLSRPPGSTREELHELITTNGWEQAATRPSSLSLLGLEEYRRSRDEDVTEEHEHEDCVLILGSQDVFPDAITCCDVAIAMAGTATEQVVGFGKPAVTLLVGQGPQFNKQFALAQERLLGRDSVKVAKTVGEAARSVEMLLGDEEALRRAKENGRERMGQPGASRRLAKAIIETIVEGGNAYYVNT
jgi:uncharacterized protein (TIGR03492 family)